MNTKKPLFVDLDGTLIHTDLLVESFMGLLNSYPLYVFAVPLWLLRGKAHLKAQLSRLVPIDIEHLPFNEALLGFLRQEHNAGRSLYLATASNVCYASAIAAHLGIFKAVLASDERTNLSGNRKLDAIKKAAPDGFVYAGNDHVDVVIWKESFAAILVDTPATAVRQVEVTTTIEARFDRPARGIGPFVKALRPHQWLKNILVFLPLLPIAISASTSMIGAAFLAFAAFSLCASSVYLINDLSDLAADRAHPRKRKRPFAAGDLSPVVGLFLAPALLIAAVMVGTLLPNKFLVMLGIYWITTTAYTFALKRYALFDVISLASLYTLRVIGGAAAIAVTPSFWILAFSMFIFFSLALAKRYAELHAMQLLKRESAKGRGYQVPDLQVVQQMGVTSGYLSVLVMALYINSSEIVSRYGDVKLLWGVCPLLMLWVSFIWLKTSRGEMTDDPLVFAIRDKVSRWVMLLSGVVVLLALLWNR